MFATRYNPHKPSPLGFEDYPSLTQSQFLLDCDINNMIRRAITGDTSVFRNIRYVDALSSPESFHEAANRVAFADSVWEDLPEHIRASYGTKEHLLSALEAELSKVEAERKKLNVEPSKSDAPKTDIVSTSGTSSSTDEPGLINT